VCSGNLTGSLKGKCCQNRVKHMMSNGWWCLCSAVYSISATSDYIRQQELTILQGAGLHLCCTANGINVLSLRARFLHHTTHEGVERLTWITHTSLSVVILLKTINHRFVQLLAIIFMCMHVHFKILLTRVVTGPHAQISTTFQRPYNKLNVTMHFKVKKEP